MAPILGSDDYSLLHMERISQYISLPPSCLSNPLPAVCASIFSPLLLSYYPPARGIVLAYEDVQLSDLPPVSAEEKARLAQEKRKSKSRHRHEESDTDEDEDEADAKPKPLLLHIHNEYSAPFLWATATFLVWRPATGSWISARVTQQASTHLTLSHLNSFPISILRQHLPNGWTWTPSNSSYNSGGGGDEGWWTNEDGMPIEDVLRVRIRDFEGRMDGKGQGRGGLKIDGSLVTEEEEQTRGKEGEGDKRKRREGRVKKGSLKTRVPLPGEVVEVD
jgi:DNA-directed RNA polymerase I subunit RPA43